MGLGFLSIVLVVAALVATAAVVGLVYCLYRLIAHDGATSNRSPRYVAANHSQGEGM